MPVPRTPLVIALALVLLAALPQTGCGGETEELPCYSVSLRLGGALPADGRVGDYTVTIDQGWVVLGDWWLYGMDPEAAGYAALLGGLPKHAGHAHGEAEVETHVEGTFAVDLTGEPAVIATPEMTLGHYFDGSVRLRPCTDLYAPVFAADQTPVSSHDTLWGHSLLLSGTATRDGSTIHDFHITVDAEAMIAGLVYGSTVTEGGADTITTRLDLGMLLADLDFAALADADGAVTIAPATGGDSYNLIKARLQDPTLYLHTEAEAIPE